MKKPTFILTITVWFIFSWGLLFLLTFKTTGLVNETKRLIHKWQSRLHPPQDIVLFDFEDHSDISWWQFPGALLERSRDFASSGQYGAKVTYFATDTTQEEYPQISLENYNLGPKDIMDWSGFKYLRWEAYCPAGKEANVHLKLKDASRRYIDITYMLPAGEKVSFSVDLEEFFDSLDMAHIVSLNFFTCHPTQDMVWYIDNLRLEGAGGKGHFNALGEPFLKLEGVSLPPAAKRGQEIEIKFTVSTLKKIKRNYPFFIHLLPQDQIDRPSEQIYGLISLSRQPWIATSQWEPGKSYTMGPLSIYIPEENPKGAYYVRLGFFNPDAGGSPHKQCSAGGAVDFRSTYPRLRFTDPDIKDFVVGKIEIE